MFAYFYRRRFDLDEDGRPKRYINIIGWEMYKRAIRREQHDTRKHETTCATLACVLVCGSLLLGLGTILTCSGIFIPSLKDNKTPWLVTGSTCIVIGVLVLLLSVEIIINKKKVSIDDLNGSNSGKKHNSEQTGKALPIWRGMDKAKSTSGQGTLPPVRELSTPDQESLSNTIVAEFPCPRSSSFSSAPSTPKTRKKSSLTALDSNCSGPSTLLDPAKLDRHLRSNNIDGHTTTSDLVNSASETSCEINLGSEVNVESLTRESEL